MSDDEDDIDLDLPEDHAYFASADCTCEHDADEHGWSGCRIEGCPCVASWEE